MQLRYTAAPAESQYGSSVAMIEATKQRGVKERIMPAKIQYATVAQIISG